MTPVPQPQRPPMGPVEARERARALKPMFDQIEQAKQEVRAKKIEAGLDPEEDLSPPQPPAVGPEHPQWQARIEWENAQEPWEYLDEEATTTRFLPSEWKAPEGQPLAIRMDPPWKEWEYGFRGYESETILGWAAKVGGIQTWLIPHGRMWKLLASKLIVMDSRNDPKRVPLDEREVQALTRRQQAEATVNLHLALVEVQEFLGYSPQQMASEHLLDQISARLELNPNFSQAAQELAAARSRAGV